MDPVLLAAGVVATVQGIKEVAGKIGIKITGALALVLTVVVAIVTVGVKTVAAQLPLISAASLVLLVEVVVLSLGGYGLVKVASGTNTSTTKPT